jgi:hypothetical protein
MPITVFYSEERQIPDDSLEREIFGADKVLSDLDPAARAEVDGLTFMRYAVPPKPSTAFPACARSCAWVSVRQDHAQARNMPDYGTTEVADHPMALALSLRRGIILYHARQRQSPPPPWGPVNTS